MKVIGVNKYGLDILEVDGIRFTLQCANGIDTHSIKSKHSDAKTGIKSYYVHDSKIRKDKKVIKYITIRLSKYLLARDLGLKYEDFIYNPKKEQIIHKNGDNWDFSTGNLELVTISEKIKKGRVDSKLFIKYDKTKDGIIGKDSKGYDIIVYNGIVFKVYHINRKTYDCLYYKRNIKRNEIVVDNDGITHTKDILLHRYKFERENKINIPKDMVVHHIDGDSLNNDRSNLTLMLRREHTKLHSSKKRGDVI